MSIAETRQHRSPAFARRNVLGVLLCIGAAVAGATGCVRYGQPKATAVARGVYFATGNPDYDEFFVRLFRLQVELGKAPDSLTQTRAALSPRLGLTEKTDAAALRTALGKRANELRAHGLVVRVETGRESGRATLSVSGTKNATDAELLTALDQALGVVSDIRLALPTWKKELEALPPRGVALEAGLATAFAGSGSDTRDDVRQNLADARKIMGLMGPRLKEVDDASAELSKAFTSAFPEATPAPPPAPEPDQAEPESKPKAKPRSRGTGRSGGVPKAAPKPPSDTGEPPAPAKPSQGSAKPDFEP